MPSRQPGSLKPDLLLNPYQKAAVEIQMRQLERALLEVRRLVCHTPEDGLLTKYARLEASACAQIAPLIERMLAEIAAVVEEFELQPSTEDVGQHVHAQMAVAWSDLYDTMSAKLNRYGRVDPNLSDRLDPHILALIELSRRVGQVARGGSQCPELDTEPSR